MRPSKSPATHRRPPRQRLLALVAVGAVAVAGTAATGMHTIGQGETLSQIATDHGVTTGELAEANDIDDIDRVFAGQVLALPDQEAAAAKDGGGGEDSIRASGTSVRLHSVAPGETLSAIANAYGVTVVALAEANGIDDIHRLRAGDQLAIEGVGDTPADARPRASGGGVDTSRFPARLQASPERLALVPTFERWAGEYGAPLDLLMAMTWLESGWQHDVVSSAGAMGIGQIMPDTATWMEDVLIGVPLDPFDPNDNIRMAARYLRWLLDRTDGDAATALAGYYQGLGAVQTSGIFPSTRAYVADVLAFRDQHF